MRIYPGNASVPADVFADDRVTDFAYRLRDPQEWGGLGLDLVQGVELAMEFGYTSLAVRSLFGTNNGISGEGIVGFGTEEQKARWLPGMATGDVVAAFVLTEAGAGSNPAGLRTTAKADGDGYVIDGVKQSITSVPDHVVAGTGAHFVWLNRAKESLALDLRVRRWSRGGAPSDRPGRGGRTGPRARREHAPRPRPCGPPIPAWS